MSVPFQAILSDGRRHFQHGPIDLVIEAFGDPLEVEMAYAQAWARFQTALGELVAELATLRQPVTSTASTLEGFIARRMHCACVPHRPAFVTPMAAVAGAVADEILKMLTASRRLARAYVNNGGDIALYLAPGESLTTGVVALAEGPQGCGLARIGAASPVRGIATSGWRGRSLSLGIADSVTVLARTAAEADVAATLIANTVDVDDPAIRREPAAALDPDSDLGDKLVTVEVGPLPLLKVAQALDRGAATAAAMVAKGLAIEAFLVLRGEKRIVGDALSSAA
ncbi:MAG TPA: UPF0280 family protein [Alphaproteobacteria bacterium]|nr:UPF0280 family protein [Alphaproteobacteria bacterium]